MNTKIITTVFIILFFLSKGQHVIQHKNDTLPVKTKVSGLNISSKKENHSLSMFNNMSPDVAVFINNKHCSFILLHSINANKIKTINAVNKNITVDGKEYKGALYITTKANYKPLYINLIEIKNKYAQDNKLASLYFIDGKLISVDEKEIVIDENNILEVTCHIYNNVEDKIKLNIIEIFTRSEENLKKSKEIILR